MNSFPFWKIAASVGGAGLTASAVWLNAEHVADAEGWHSPLVVAGVIVTLCAASAPPLAERAGKDGQPLKAAMLWVFFGLAVAFSLSASIARSSGYVAGKVSKAETGNKQAKLAEEAYEAAKRSVATECAKRGPKCRDLETKLDEARQALAKAAPVQSADPGAERLAAVLGIEEAKVQLYVPLFLPLGLEIGGFIFLAFGLAPGRREEQIAIPAIAIEPVAIAEAEPATPMQTIANAAAKPPAAGTRAYYLQRLQRDFPELAAKVADGELSVYGASIAAGLRKPAGKKSQWTQIETYAPPVAANA